MKVLRQITVLDAADVDTEAAFWAGLLDGTIEPDEGWRSIVVDGEWRMGIQYAPNHVAPEWPDGAQQQQVHMDIWVDEPDVAHQKVIALGARLLKRADTATEDPFPGLRRPRGPPVLPVLVQPDHLTPAGTYAPTPAFETIRVNRPKRIVQRA